MIFVCHVSEVEDVLNFLGYERSLNVERGELPFLAPEKVSDDPERMREFYRETLKKRWGKVKEWLSSLDPDTDLVLSGSNPLLLALVGIMIRNKRSDVRVALSRFLISRIPERWKGETDLEELEDAGMVFPETAPVFIKEIIRRRTGEEVKIDLTAGGQGTAEYKGEKIYFILRAFKRAEVISKALVISEDILAIKKGEYLPF